MRAPTLFLNSSSNIDKEENLINQMGIIIGCRNKVGLDLLRWLVDLTRDEKIRKSILGHVTLLFR